MDEYIPPKLYIPHTKELLLERIRLEENCIQKPFDTAEIYALQKAVLVLDAYEKGGLVERKKGKWELNAPDDFIVYCSECMMPQDSPCNFCPSCGADMR